MKPRILPVLLKDGYKVGHKFQYPTDTEFVYSNLTPRSSRRGEYGLGGVIFFGLQYFLIEYLVRRFNEDFFARPRDEVVAEYKRRIDNYLGPGVDVSHIGALHDLGYLPLKIKAVPEGAYVPYNVPALTIVNTNAEFFWLTNMLETLMSSVLWKASTSATTALRYRQVFEDFARRTGSPADFIQFQGHDFSFRGMCGVEDASVSGAGHLLSFTGTDTIPAIDFLEEFYGANSDRELIGASVAATEHSVMCMTNPEGEEATFERLLTEIYPTGILSVVSDTWDLWTVLTDYLPHLKDVILGRNGKLVIRPDCYDEQTSVLTDSGWRLFSQLKPEDLVAQVLPDHSYEFVQPTRRVEQDYNGYMVRFSDEVGKCDLLVTPNHRMLWNRRKSGDRVVEAGMSNVGSVESKMYRSAAASDKGRPLSSLDKLRIAYQADGSPGTREGVNPTSGRRSYRFNFAKERKTQRLITICKEGGFEYKVYDEPAHQDQLTVSVWLAADVEMLKDLSWVDTSSLCGSWARDFIEEVSYWNATRRSNDRFKFDTTVPSVAETVELVALAAGYGVLVSVNKDDREGHFSDVYSLHIMKDNMLGGQAIQRQYEWYTGKIHCVTVPSGMLLVKRGRGTAVCGNSGDPVKIVCGDPEAPEGSPARLGVLQLLWDIFGGTETSTGHRLLDSHIGIIYGDGISPARQVEMLSGMAAMGFASANIVLGLGSYTYQYVTRDTDGWAMKATWGQTTSRGGVDIFKNPITDDGSKRSARGRLRVDEQDGHLVLRQRCTPEEEEGGLLEVVFLDGKITRTETLSEIRNRVNKYV